MELKASNNLYNRKYKYDQLKNMLFTLSRHTLLFDLVRSLKKTKKKSIEMLKVWLKKQ